MLRACLLVLLLATGVARAAGDATEARIVHLTERLRCLVCQNQSIAESNAELAVDLKRQVREMIEAGKSDQEISDYMVQRYGDFVLYEPPVKAVTLLLWAGPALLLALALGGFVWSVRRRDVQASGEEVLDEEQRAAARALLAGDPADTAKQNENKA